MNLKIAHLGPPGTYAEQAAFFYLNWLQTYEGITAKQSFELCPYPTIAQSLQAVIKRSAEIAVVPVENSIEGSVNMTLDSLWQLDINNLSFLFWICNAFQSIQKNCFSIYGL
jgi:prephenate dehydratase